ncbi:MAG: hypothetical protein NDJ90_01170 [Oligoflexia bacterium]|nr:hypothetical protein [Oligoflexia bacterium]
MLARRLKDAPDEFNPQTLRIDIGSSNGLIGRSGDVIVMKASINANDPPGGTPLGKFHSTETKLPPNKYVQLQISKSNGLSGKKGNIAIVQAFPGGGRKLLELPHGPSSAPGNKDGWTRIYIGPGNGISGKKGDIVVVQEAPYGGRLLASYPRDAIDLNDQDEIRQRLEEAAQKNSPRKGLRREAQSEMKDKNVASPEVNGTGGSSESEPSAAAAAK